MIFRWRKEHAESSSEEEESGDNKSGSGSSEESDSDEDVSTFCHSLCVQNNLSGAPGLYLIQNSVHLLNLHKKLNQTYFFTCHHYFTIYNQIWL